MKLVPNTSQVGLTVTTLNVLKEQLKAYTAKAPGSDEGFSKEDTTSLLRVALACRAFLAEWDNTSEANS